MSSHAIASASPVSGMNLYVRMAYTAITAKTKLAVMNRLINTGGWSMKAQARAISGVIVMPPNRSKWGILYLEGLPSDGGGLPANEKTAAVGNQIRAKKA